MVGKWLHGEADDMLITTAALRSSASCCPQARPCEQFLHSLLTELHNKSSFAGAEHNRPDHTVMREGSHVQSNATRTAPNVRSHTEGRAERQAHLIHKLHFFVLLVIEQAFCSCQGTWRFQVRFCSLLSCLLEMPLLSLVCGLWAFVSCIVGSCHLHVTCVSFLERPCPLSKLQELCSCIWLIGISAVNLALGVINLVCSIPEMQVVAAAVPLQQDWNRMMLSQC